jgi:thioredoxin 1
MKNIVTIAVILCVGGFQTSCAQNQSQDRNQNQAQAQQARSQTDDLSEQFADRIADSKIPVLVDFWAGWCMPCLILDPVIAELETEYKGRVLFMKVDTEIHKAITHYFKVRALPTVFVIEDRTVRAALPGVRSKSEYKQAIEDALKLAAERSAPPQKPEEKRCLNC